MKIWSVNLAMWKMPAHAGLLALVALAFFPRRRVSLAHPIKSLMNSSAGLRKGPPMALCWVCRFSVSGSKTL